jgi:hypothetical protein
VETAKKKGVKDWKGLVKTKPPKLDPKLKTLISQIYMATTNEITGKTIFDVPKLANIIKIYKQLEKSSIALL